MRSGGDCIFLYAYRKIAALCGMDTSVDDAIKQLRQAETKAEMDAAILSAISLGLRGMDSPRMQLEIENTMDRRDNAASRLARVHQTGLVDRKQRKQHDKRVSVLQVLNRQRANGVDTGAVEHQIKEMCKNGTCPHCVTMRGDYQATCITFLLTCIGVRIKTRLKFDRKWSYNIDSDLHELMDAYVADPLRTWIHRNADVRNLPSRLQGMHTERVIPTVGTFPESQEEADKYASHVESIRLMLITLSACDRSLPP